MSMFRLTWFFLFILIAISPFLFGQSVETPIYEQAPSAIKESQEKNIQKALLLRGKVSAISKEEIDKQIINPLPEPVKLAPVLTQQMTTEQIAAHARKSNLRVGYCYKCMHCDHWHLNLAGGYAIAPNVIVTCQHVLSSKTQMKDGFLVVYDHEGNIACGVAVLAQNPVMDTAIIKVAGANFNPVPLNSNVKQGSASYCFSYPLRQQGYFSTGVINRFLWDDTYNGEDKQSIDGLAHLRINYSNDWAPGSSGSPLFDAAGNVTGHVSTIYGLAGGKDKQVYLTLHEGIAARIVERLVETLKSPEEIKRLANMIPLENKNPEITKPSEEK
jgi:hypothetical protein